jgi:Icc protein
MTQIAHLSDFHLLDEAHEQRSRRERLRLSYLSFGRPKSPLERRKRALSALIEARRSGAHHLVLTGDLTEEGLPAQFELLAEVLHESGWSPSRVTLVPGNHDAYAGPEAWQQALDGPLLAFRATSVLDAPLHLHGTVLLPLSTATHQPYTRSAGSIEGAAFAALQRAAKDSHFARSPLLLAMHHPPRRHLLPPMQWIDGLREHAAMGALLAEHDHLHVLHGHTHVAKDHAVRPGAAPRIFSTEAVVESASPLRVYLVRHGRLWPQRWVDGGVMALAPA